MYENLLPYEDEPHISLCDMCDQQYGHGNEAWIEFEEGEPKCFCSTECKEEWKKDLDKETIEEIVAEGP